ncbi:MAG: hypothetical protein WDA75_19695 [Candidatus Latescibacterota bacterium]|jgi:hypothetical protein
MTRLLGVALVLLWGVTVEAETTTVQVGGLSIAVPAPVGFYEVSSISPPTWKLALGATPPASRLLAVFVDESDLGRVVKGEPGVMASYMFLQVPRETEMEDLSAAEFRQVDMAVEQQQAEVLAQAKAKYGPLIDRVAGAAGEYFRVSVG